jgi:hypothetical protein
MEKVDEEGNVLGLSSSRSTPSKVSHRGCPDLNRVEARTAYFFEGSPVPYSRVPTFSSNGSLLWAWGDSSSIAGQGR